MTRQPAHQPHHRRRATELAPMPLLARTGVEPPDVTRKDLFREFAPLRPAPCRPVRRPA